MERLTGVLVVRERRPTFMNSHSDGIDCFHSTLLQYSCIPTSMYITIIIAHTMTLNSQIG